MPTVIRQHEYRARPWRNGGGETHDILVHPPQATLENFDWRISMARIERDGPFSAFPGVERTLLVLSGAMSLQDARDKIRLTTAAAPFSFDGAHVFDAVIEHGPLVDLNVMTRRGRAAHQARRRRFDAQDVLRAGPGTLVLFTLEAGLIVDGHTLEAHDTVLISSQDSPAELRVVQSAAAVIIEIR